MRRDEEGFTLIELAVSVGIFGVVLVSLSLLFRSSFTTVNQARYDQTAKTLAQEKMEEIRGLPFHVPLKENAADVDLLDRYFVDADNLQDTTPAGAIGNYNGATNVWAYASTDTIDPADAPPFTRTVTVQFAVPTSGGTLVVRPPNAGYDSDDPALDAPSTTATKVTVAVAWVASGRDRSLSLETVIAELDQETLNVASNGSAIGAQVSGLIFQDGDAGVGAEIRAVVADGDVAFRELEGTAQASGDPLQVSESDPATNLPVQAEGPTTGQSSATVPNSTTGNEHVPAPASLPAGAISSVNDPISVIASWASSSPSASTEARVSNEHTLNPEARTQVSAVDVSVNFRDAGDTAPHRAVELGTTATSVEHRSTVSSAAVTSVVDLTPSGTRPGVAVWGARQFVDHPDFAGVVVMDSVHVEVESIAGATTSSTRIEWQVTNLRVWDPALENPDGPPGGYTAPVTFGFLSDCGGWVGDPTLCGSARTDGKLPFENPNPVVLPPAYAGTDGQGDAATSLQIIAGITVQDAAADAATGVSNAAAAQKNVLSITTRDDIQGAQALEPMLVGLGDVNSSVSYVAHEH